MFREMLCMFTMCLISILWKAGSTKGDKVCTPFTTLRGPHPQGICGNKIDEMLDLMCENGLNEMFLFKRGSEKAKDTKSLQEINKVLLSKEDANTYLVKRDEFHQTGIVCECCYHPCDLPELLSYCRGPIFKRNSDSGRIIN